MLDAFYWVLALVLVGSGVSKLSGGAAVGETLTQLGLPSPRRAGVIVGVYEVLVGAAALMAPPGAVASVVAVLVSLTYAVFALVVGAALRAGLEDCGCIGVRPTRPSAFHVGLDVLAAVVAAAAAVATPVDLVGGLAALALPAAVLVGLAVAVGAGAVVSLLDR